LAARRLTQACMTAAAAGRPTLCHTCCPNCPPRCHSRVKCVMCGGSTGETCTRPQLLGMCLACVLCGACCMLHIASGLDYSSSAPTLSHTLAHLDAFAVLPGTGCHGPSQTRATRQVASPSQGPTAWHTTSSPAGCSSKGKQQQQQQQHPAAVVEATTTLPRMAGTRLTRSSHRLLLQLDQEHLGQLLLAGWATRSHR
jgi:hypothetical protein